jgi:hypothetical protein
MAAHSFSVTFTGPALDTLTKARSAIEKQGGTLKGDDAKGDFVVSTPAGKVKGTYAISGQTFTLNITDKPFIVPMSAIETQVRKFVG